YLYVCSFCIFQILFCFFRFYFALKMMEDLPFCIAMRPMISVFLHHARKNRLPRTLLLI
ncbi:hypothetical protein L9F63_001058, partial [Diploptera punctata]